MAYRAEVLQRARARLAQQKADRESQNTARLQAAYARLPRLKEIDMALVSTMAQAAQAAFLQGSDGRELLEQVAALPEKLRTVIHLHYYEGYSLEEMAALLGVTVSAVKMRMKRGRDALRIRLEGME